MAWRYDRLKEEMLQGKILDIGISDKNYQLKSKNREFFLSDNYLAIEPRDVKTKLRYKKTDLLNLDDKEETYDLILCFEVLEHICFYDWEKVISKLKGLLKKEGILIISVPHNQQMEEYINVETNYTPYNMHVTFSITKNVMKKFFPNAKIRVIRNWLFKEQNESSFRALLRHIKRVITWHHFVSYKILPKFYSYVFIEERRT